MIRTQISFERDEYEMARLAAAAQRISLADFVRRAVSDKLPPRDPRAPGCAMWDSSKVDSQSSQSIDAIVYGTYVDTSALIALLDRSDSYHPLFRRLFSAPPALVTSALVVAEGHGWFLRRYDQRRAIQFLNFLRELRPVTIMEFGREQAGKAADEVKKFADQNLTLADAHGLLLMRQRRITQCRSTDRHLSLTGAPLVI
jgi:predicted nucleic acid-binding protein